MALEIATAKGPRVPVEQMTIPPDATVGDAVQCIDRSGRVSLALIVDAQGRLLNTISDGDVRRGLLIGIGITDPVAQLVAIKSQTPHPLPVTAHVDTDAATLLDLMRARAVRQVPLVTLEGHVVDVVILADLLPEEPRALQAVVMAGGFGTRLRPLTESMPKPMLPIGGKPVMELIIDQLQQTGVRQVNVATHYQAEKIVDHFGDGNRFGVDIKYYREESPLGTAGALGLMDRPKDPVLVINGDILTDIDFRAMHSYHSEYVAKMTVAVRRYEVQVPYGVIDCEGAFLRGIREKPQLGFLVNAGIYIIEPSVYDHIPRNAHFNMTDLIEALLSAGETVVSFPVREYWLDIGQHADYEKAQIDAAQRQPERPNGAVGAKR